ncbi:hypothetical protein CHS0354_004964 [Potamilus streckersoni]|uniref:SEFIR domain-containing protein n=1 Tax=Potamilus streckersoni TaxID=2493646 RepID=A0AAE0VGF5_9BIVA|nr:hypothetical protein CHS0354_004964 [Potamilus streckersoni]
MVLNGIPCAVYSYKDEACMLPQLSDLHPGLYQPTNEGAFPGPPGLLSAMIYENSTLYGLNITFMLPKSGNVSNLEGFELQYVNSQVYGESCRIVDLSNQTLMPENRETVFFVMLYPVKVSTTYYLMLKSLPLSPEMNSIAIGITVPYKRNVKVAMDWSTSISFKNNSYLRQVCLVFKKPPAEFNFTQFEVTLMPLPVTEQLRKQRIIIYTFDHTFRDVIPGQYYLQVKPVDDFTGNCICRDTSNICQQCITTETFPFFIYNVSTTTTSITTTSTEPPSSSAIPPMQAPSDPNTLKIILAVIGSVLGVAIILFFGWFFWEKRKPKDKGNVDGNQHGRMQQLPVIIEDTESVVTVPIIRRNFDRKKLISVPKRKVCILYAEDHECHEKVVESLVTYLQSDCSCDVMYAQWSMDVIRHNGPLFWMQQSLNSADCVIIINSEAAYKIVEADKERKEFKPVKSSPLSNLFLPGIKLVMSKFIQDHQYNKFIMVRFDYTSENYVLKEICPGLCYCLTKHFTEFLCHIHGLTQNHDFTLFDLPLETNHLERDKGLKLCDAVKKAQKYENQHPKWFSEKFLSPRSSSMYSDDQTHDSGVGDISPHNLTPQHSLEDSSLEMQISQQHLSDIDQFHIPNNNSTMEIFTIHPEDVDIFPTENYEYQNQRPQNGCGHLKNHKQCPDPSEFIPPSEIGDDDRMSRTISEQIQSINNRYMDQKIMDYDNYLLQVQMGDIHEYKALDFETHSLGGQSV